MRETSLVEDGRSTARGVPSRLQLLCAASAAGAPSSTPASPSDDFNSPRSSCMRRLPKDQREVFLTIPPPVRGEYEHNSWGHPSWLGFREDRAILTMPDRRRWMP